MIELGYRRADGSAVGLVNGMPYHFTEESPYWPQVAGDVDGLSLQEAVLVNGNVVGFIPEYVNGVLQTDPGIYATPPPTSADVNVERARREQAGCTVIDPVAGQIPLDGNERSMRNLQGLAFAASLRLGQGDTTTVTVFRDAQNNNHSLVPAQVVSLWSQGAAYISALYAASWAIKSLDPIPADYADDSRWPAYE